MPYQSNDELPKLVRDRLSESQQTIFRRVVNQQLSRGSSEAKAFASAWASVGPIKKADSYSPPQGVRSNAKRGLELREKWGRGGLDTSEAGKQGIGSGVARARDLSSGKNISLDTIKRMKSFFARHEQNKDGKDDDGGPSAGAIAWLLWGGDAGKRWAESILDKVEKCVDVKKINEEQRIVFGFASVADVVDQHGDIIEADELEKAAYHYVLESRRGDEMHVIKGVGNLVESMVFTKEKQELFGLDIPISWWVGIKLSPESFERVKKGDYIAFSIGGSAYGEKTN